MAEKKTTLSITIRAVDQATAKLKAIVAEATKPMRDFRKQLSELRENSGLGGVISGFHGVGNAVSGVLAKVGMIGGVVGAATAGLMSIIDDFDQLGDKAERVGVGVDALAQLRWAAEKSGASVESLDTGLQGFSKSLGQARAGTGRMSAFLSRVSPALLKQLKAAKSNEQAFDLLADAMTKLEDPAKRAALASATLGDAALAPMLAKGSKGIAELRKEHLQLTGPLTGATEAAGSFGDSMDRLKAITTGVKARLVEGLAPALKVVVDRLSQWFTAHREDIAQWARDIGERLPGAVQKVVAWVQTAVDRVSAFVDKIGGLGTVAKLAGVALLAGPVASIFKLVGAMGSAIGRAGQLGKALASMPAAGGAAGGAGALGALGPIGLAVGSALAVNELTGGSIGVGQGGAMGLAEQMLKRQERLKQLGSSGRTEFTDTVFRAMEGVRAKEAQQAKITIDLANAPRGTRVRTDPQSTADVDLSVGYQLNPAF